MNTFGKTKKKKNDKKDLPTIEDEEKIDKKEEAKQLLLDKEFAKQEEINKENKRNNIKESLKKFFKNKDFYAGGPIPEHDLFSKKNLDFIMETSWGEGYELAFAKLKIKGKQLGDDKKMDVKIREGVDKCLSIIKECREMDIPNSYITGIINLYLQYCEGAR